MPGEVSRAFDPDPDDDKDPRDRIVYDVDLVGEYDTPTLKGEIIRLRKLLTDCWDVTGLLSGCGTGEEWMAWEDDSDLLPQLESMAADALEYELMLEDSDEEES